MGEGDKCEIFKFRDKIPIGKIKIKKQF